MNTYTTAEETIPLFSKRLQEHQCKEFLVWIVSRGFVASSFDRPERVSVLQVKQVTERDVVITLALQTTWKDAMSEPRFPLHQQVFDVQWKTCLQVTVPVWEPSKNQFQQNTASTKLNSNYTALIQSVWTATRGKQSQRQSLCCLQSSTTVRGYSDEPYHLKFVPVYMLVIFLNF